MSRLITKQRERLWHRDNRCYWCRKPTRLLSLTNGRAPDDMATIDHLYSRLDENRRNVNHGVVKRSHSGNTMVIRRVLACYACNQERGRLECKLTKLKEQREASLNGIIPKKHRQSKQNEPRILHECGYPERHRRLQILQQRAEKDVAGLISVMGLPLKDSMGVDISGYV